MNLRRRRRRRWRVNVETGGSRRIEARHARMTVARTATVINTTAIPLHHRDRPRPTPANIVIVDVIVDDVVIVVVIAVVIVVDRGRSLNTVRHLRRPHLQGTRREADDGESTRRSTRVPRRRGLPPIPSSIVHARLLHGGRNDDDDVVVAFPPPLARRRCHIISSFGCPLAFTSCSPRDF